MASADLKTLRFEPLAEHHIGAILAIEKETNTSPWSERSFKNELINRQSIFLVALLSGVVAGYGGLWVCVDEGHITTLAVGAEHRRKGIGRKLMDELLSKAKPQGVTCSTLEVRAGNLPAIELYKAMGYVEVARRKAYYPDNKEDAVVMWLYDL